MKDYQISVDEAFKMDVFELSRKVIEGKHRKDKYVPVGLKCCKKDDESLRKLYSEYSINLLYDLLFNYGIKEAIIFHERV